MAGFIRRYGNFPGTETITLIEGVVIVDLPPPGSITGLSTGTVGLVGEFADMTYATAVSSTGVVSTLARPVEVFSGQDMIDKVGGFDETIGSFGVSDGNGFAAIRNKKFSRLIIVPTNLASSAAGRVWRDLPTNLSATQAIPVVPLLGGVVAAGRQFVSGVNRVRLGKKVIFTALGHYKNGIDGATTTAGAAATQVLTSATGGFLTGYNGGPIPKGAIVVLGQIGGSGALGTNAGVYRVQAQATVDTTLTLEKLDGTSFVLTTGTAQPFRIHPQTDADYGGTGGVATALSDLAGYQLPCRPLDATIAGAAQLTPSVVPTAATAGSWDSLSGLRMAAHPSTGFVYTSTIQGVNAVNDATIDALYSTAIDALLTDTSPGRDVNILFAARTSTTINAKIKSHVLAASSVGIGRVGLVSPPLTTTTVAAAVADTAPGVGANRDERVFFSWPGAQTSIPEAVGFTLGTADGLTTTTGILDTRGDAWLASVLSNLPPERNPGQAAPPVPTLLASVLGLQRGLPAIFGMSEYTQLRASGVAGLRIDRTVGPIFQSGVTTSLVSGQKNINRRRMADFIQDSVAQRLVQFNKLPLTTALKDSVTSEIDTFLNLLKSPSNPPAQRIVDYQIDDVSGNTPALLAAGIYVVIGRVQTLSTADFIVFQTEVGEGVRVTAS